MKNAHHVHSPVVTINQSFYTPADTSPPPAALFRPHPEQPAAQLALDLGTAMPPGYRTDVPISPAERQALESYRTISHHSEASARDLLFMVSRVALAHPEMMWRQLVADVRYSDNEGMKLLDYWNSLMAFKPSRKRGKQ